MEAFDLYPKLQHRQDIWLLNVILKMTIFTKPKMLGMFRFFFFFMTDCDEHGP